MITLKQVFQFSGSLVLVVCLMDLGGWAMWEVSGQHPQDNFYAGAISAQVLGAPR